MYYKITNTECSAYKKLVALRKKELGIEVANFKKIKERVALEWKAAFGHHGQQHYLRVKQYRGFEFVQPECVDPKVWKQHDEHHKVFVPNKRTKAGREMSLFLSGMQSSWFEDVFKAVGVKYEGGRFSFPFLELVGDVVYLYIDDQFELKGPNYIEITKTEMQTALKSAKPILLDEQD